MSISQVRFTSNLPAVKVSRKPEFTVVKHNAPVAFTGINYASTTKKLIKKMDFPAIWQRIKNLFRAAKAFLLKCKPHIDRANESLAKKGSELWKKLSPVTK